MIKSCVKGIHKVMKVMSISWCGSFTFLLIVASSLLVLTGAAGIFFSPKSGPKQSVLLKTLRASFDADIRNLVFEWDQEDQRTDGERRAALFEFVYQGNDSSAWIPQSLFDGNRFTQAVMGDNVEIIGNLIGLVPWTENRVVKAFGMAPNPVPDQPLSWTVNCLACHTAEIDGVVYFGAGGKVLDEKMLADTVKLVTNRRGRQILSSAGIDHNLAEHAHEVMERHHHDQIDPVTRGRSTAFPASHVEMYMRSHGGKMPANQEVGRGDVKAPPLWHTAAKQTFGRWYCDGSFHAGLPLMASSMELELDNSFDKLVTSVLPRIKLDFQAVVEHLRPPKYPYSIDRSLAEEGRALFYSDEVGCYRCHGIYDGKGNVNWTGTHMDVGTDRARMNVVSQAFIDAFNSSPLASEGQLQKSEGYAATPLTGVWANYPYLHNGSVPTLHHLLGPASERPRLFSVVAARKFDPECVGQRLSSEISEPASESQRVHSFGKDRNWFNADRPGCDNQGHDFWPRIKTNANRRALIEYLKTL
jgi:RoxA-like, cytochrome c-like